MGNGRRSTGEKIYQDLNREEPLNGRKRHSYTLVLAICEHLGLSPEQVCEQLEMTLAEFADYESQGHFPRWLRDAVRTIARDMGVDVFTRLDIRFVPLARHDAGVPELFPGSGASSGWSRGGLAVRAVQGGKRHAQIIAAVEAALYQRPVNGGLSVRELYDLVDGPETLFVDRAGQPIAEPARRRQIFAGHLWREAQMPAGQLVHVEWGRYKRRAGG